MRCVCPEGGDRTCPVDCPLAKWDSLSTADRKTQRKTFAETLYRRGLTQEQIATQLGVSQTLISFDLADLLVSNKLKPKTASNPKGAGRPKGSRVAAPKRHYKETSIVALVDAGLSRAEIAAQTGIGERQVRHVAERELIRREARAEPEIDPSTFSLSVKQKFDAAIRQEKARLEASFERRILDEVRRRMDEITLPYWKEQIAEAKKLYNARKALMDKATFNAIRRALHPDSRNSISDEILSRAFDKFMALEKFLLDEKDSPTSFGDLPSNAADWERMRVKRKSTKGNGHMVRR